MIVRDLFADDLGDGVIVIRRPLARDLEAIARYIGADEAQAWLSGVGDPATLLAEFIAGWADPPEPSRLGLTLVVADAAGDALVGVVHVDAEMGTLFVSYGVAPDRRRRGIASRALLLLCQRAFASGFRRVALEIGDDNIASQGVARRSGFEPTGGKRTQVTEDGTVWHAKAWARSRGNPA